MIRARPPAAVWWLVALQLAVALAWSVWTPTWRAPDEPHHVDLARELRRGASYPEPFAGRISAQVAETTRLGNLSPVGAPVPDRDVRFEAAEAPPRGDRPSFAAAGPPGPTGYPNQMPQHPPLYYRLLASVLALVGEGMRWDLQVWVLRVVNALMVAPLPLLCWAAAQRVVGAGPAAVAAAVVPVAVPQLAHTAGAVNNDNLLALLGGVATVFLAHAAIGDVRARVAAGAGAATGLALLTKAFALAFLPALMAAYAVAAWRARRAEAPAGRAVRAGLTAIGLALVVGGWWWGSNVLTYGTLQPDAFAAPDAPAGFTTDVAHWATYFASRVVLRFWGQFGWLEAPLAWPLVWALFGLLAAGVVAGLALRGGRRVGEDSPPDRPVRVVLLVPLVTMLAALAAGTWGMYARTGQTAGVQGRYLYGALVGLAVVAATGWVTLAGRLRRAVAPALLVLAGALQVVGMRTAGRRWWGPSPDTGVRDMLPAMAAWAAPGRGVLLGIAALVIAAAAGAGVALVLQARR